MSQQQETMANFNADWEQEAENWARWVRTPGHDSFDQFNGDEFFKLVPDPCKATIDIGCGEGRVTRRLKTQGHTVTSVDASPTLVGLAEEEDKTGSYSVADAAQLPFADGSFDLAISMNVLMDVADMPGAVSEAARILTSGGRFCICITHPLNDAGGFQGEGDDAPFIIDSKYYGRRRLEMAIERDNLSMTFKGWCYPLEDYSKALEAAGLLIEKIREPVPSNEVVQRLPHLARWQRVPMFMHILALKP